MAKNKVSYSFLEYLAAFLFFLVYRPSFTWGMSDFLILIPLAGVLLLHLELRNKSRQALFLFFFMTLAIIPIAHGASIMGFLFYTVFAVVPFLKEGFVLHTFKISRFVFAVVTGISLVVWVMVMGMQIDLPHTVIPPLNELKDYNYLSYPFLAVPLTFENYFRFACMFDEPGVVGTYSLLFLYVGEFNFKDWKNVVFLLAGLAAFSLFFFISFVFFLLFRMFTKSSMKKYRFATIAVIVALFALVQASPVMNEMIGARLEYDEERGTIAGNNRSGTELDEYIASIRGTKEYFFGVKPEIVEEFNANAGIKNAVLRYGAVFVFLFFAFFLIFSKSKLKHNNREVVSFMLLLFLTLYQRPGFINPSYLFMFTMAVLSRVENIQKTFASRSSEKYLLCTAKLYRRNGK